MNHVKTLLSDHFIGIDKLDPLVRAFDTSVKEYETVMRFLIKFNFKTK